MKKRWVIKQAGEKEKVKALAKALNVDDKIANLLVQRNIFTFQEAKTFFRPSLSDLFDPFLMKDMEKAVERISKAIHNKEKILVYGDYDVDGTTAVALVYTYIKSFYNNIDFYIPDRYTEGYGISFQGIEFAEKHNFGLIIALDCGIKAVEVIAHANTKHIDVLVCDHHRPDQILPPAYAVLDPKREDCKYPYKELSGCGVGFKLIQAFQHNFQASPLDLFSLLDLVAVSIAADIVPVTGENRIFAYHGLKLINTNPRPGIEAILKYSNIFRKKDAGEIVLSRKLGISDLVFLVGPRINAAGRIESARDSVKLLLSEDLQSADVLGLQINMLNTERRNLDALATQQALEMIQKDVRLLNSKSTVVYHPEWHKGVIGIVASRLTETYYRPTVVFTKAQGLITGSARSIKNFDIYEAINSCRHLLEHFGGHTYAAGLSLKPQNLALFIQNFEKFVCEHTSDDMLVPEIEIDAVLNLNDINPKFYRILKQFAPFGPGNMSPVFKAENLVDTGFAKIVGENHLRFNLVHPEISTLPFQAIAFQQAEKFPCVKKNTPFSICYHIEENTWNGTTSLQLNVKDIAIDD